MIIRNYKDSDYESIAELYKNSDLYGGHFDENRDSRERLSNKIKDDPEAILVCESEGKILGTVSLVEDGRVAWLFRFAVLSDSDKETVTKSLFEKASEILKARGHKEVLVYSPVGNKNLDSRYKDLLGFEKGADYTCFWKGI
jgi:N-acetylglutamate synthase-like GNAT family acetyltransferase